MGLSEIAIAFTASRIFLVAAGLAGLAVLGLGNRRLDLLPDSAWLSMFVQWDAAHYVDVALHGYSFEPGRLPTLPFFPLYPLLVRIAVEAVGTLDVTAASLAGLVVANASLFIALLYLAALVSRDLSVSVARRTVLYVLVLPVTFFLSAVYAEALFLATAVACLYHARAGEWYRAGLAGALGALTRPFGVLLIVPLAVEMLRQRPNIRSLPALALVPAGLAVYFAYLWAQFGDPFVYFEANQSWGRRLTLPWDALAGYVHNTLQLYDWPYSILDLASVVLMAVLAILSWRLLPASYAAFATVGLLFLVSSGGAWFSASRHGLALFPLFVVLAVLGERRAFHWAWLAVSIVLAAAFMARFAGGHWVA